MWARGDMKIQIPHKLGLTRVFKPPELHLTACFSPEGSATGQRVTR